MTALVVAKSSRRRLNECRPLHSVSTASKSRYGDIVAHDQDPQVQEDVLRQVAIQRGWQVHAVYSDRESGTKENRPGLGQLMADARRRRFDVVMVFRFDRLSRSVRHFLQVVEELHGAGVGLYSHEQNLDTSTPMGQFTLTMFAALAELERSVLRERVKAGLEHARRNGTKSGRPIGRPRVAVDPARVVALRQQGLSWSEIRKELGVGKGTAQRALSACPKPSQDGDGANV